MKRRVPSPLRFAALAAVAATGLMGLSSTAFAIAPPGSLTATPASPNKATDWAFTWIAPPADAGNTADGFEGGLVASEADLPTGTLISGGSIAIPAEGSYFFKVRARQTDDTTQVLTTSDYAVIPVVVDRTPPLLGAALQGTPIGGWYGGTPVVNNVTQPQRTLTILREPCSDPSGLQAPGCAPIVWTQDGVFTNNQITATDIAGNTSTATASFNFDATKPSTAGGQPSQPGPTALVAAEPTFFWTPGIDVTSGVASYQLQYKLASDSDTDYITIADVPHGSGPGDYSAKRDANLAKLPENELLDWRVRTIDKAGNFRNSVSRRLTIDSTIPAAPSITGGPGQPTTETSPTFTWEGTEKSFLWDLTRAGTENPIRQGGGAATQTTLAALPDGDYTFRVSQVTEAGQKSAEASRSFKVDTTPPAAPVIVARPTFPSIGVAPVFSWGIEPGAFSRWTVLSATGVVVGPIDTPVTSAELPQLAEGPYTFQVVQIDAAGNVSPTTSESFTVIAPLVAPTPAQNARTAFLAALPKQNALRLLPKAGSTLPTLRPVLRWKKGPRGTKLYNLQIFQVTPRKGKAKPKVTKVLSRFPRGRQFRPPNRNLKPNTCYVWRVWPYTGTAFTARPVGVSNFCVAGSKVLRAKAAKAAANRAAAKSRR